MNRTSETIDDYNFIKRHTGGHVRSPRFDFAHIGRKLSNRKINEYIREGRYGETAQKKLLAADERRKETTARILAKQRKMEKLLDELGI